MNSGFTKLFSSLVTSSLWVEPDPILRVWIAMLATCDAKGEVQGSIPGFASLCRITVEDMEAAEAKLLSPDPHSRSKECEGRRIERVEGGWKIINYLKYREKSQDKPGSRAGYFRDYRTRNAQQSDVARNTEAEAEAEAEAEGASSSTGTAFSKTNSFECSSEIKNPDWNGNTLTQKMQSILGPQEIAKRPDWLRRLSEHPGWIAEIMDVMHANINEGSIIKNRGGYAEELWKKKLL